MAGLRLDREKEVAPSSLEAECRECRLGRIAISCCRTSRITYKGPMARQVRKQLA